MTTILLERLRSESSSFSFHLNELLSITHELLTATWSTFLPGRCGVGSGGMTRDDHTVVQRSFTIRQSITRSPVSRQHDDPRQSQASSFIFVLLLSPRSAGSILLFPRLTQPRLKFQQANLQHLRDLLWSWISQDLTPLGVRDLQPSKLNERIFRPPFDGFQPNGRDPFCIHTSTRPNRNLFLVNCEPFYQYFIPVVYFNPLNDYWQTIKRGTLVQICAETLWVHCFKVERMKLRFSMLERPVRLSVEIVQISLGSITR